MAMLLVPFKDLIVNETDGAARMDLVRRDGSLIESDVLLRISSEILQDGDKFGAKELNAFLDRDSDGNLYPKMQTREWI